MKIDPSVVTAIFHQHHVREPWAPLPSTGVANEVFATTHVVLRIATDHPDAASDARTESVAAPVAHAAGILTPRPIAFDHSGSLIDRPFSLWERIHGSTLGLLDLSRPLRDEVWWQVGRELACLHTRVSDCHDPHGYLDIPERDADLEATLRRLLDAGLIGSATAREVGALLQELEEHIPTAGATRFLHNDMHAMNVMCSTSGSLLALIDWGDAGWGDPLLDFAGIPLDAMPAALAGYQSEAPSVHDPISKARLVWDKIGIAMDDLVAGKASAIDVPALIRFLHSDENRGR